MNTPKNWFQLQPFYAYLRKQAEKERFFKYLEIGATFTLIIIFLFFAIMPTMTAIFSLLGEIKAKKVYIEKVDAKIINIIKAQKTYGEIQDQYSLVEDTFPMQPKFYNGATNLATIFKDSSLKINNLNLSLTDSKEINEKFLDSYQVNISGEGDYLSVLEMVKKIFNNRRLVDVSTIQIFRPDSKEDVKTSTLRVTLNNSLYFIANN